MDKKEFGLNYSFPQKTPIQVMFVAESPPAKGFFYDKDSDNNAFRKKLFKLINEAGLGKVDSLEEFSGKGYYLADALNCRWDKTKKKKLPKSVIRNCSIHLAAQIELFKPGFIVVLGRNAQRSVQLDEPQKVLQKLQIPSNNIIYMTFILVASNETDYQRICKLRKIAENN